MSMWETPPPVVVLSGDETFFLVRELRTAISGADAAGRSVEYLEGSSRNEIAAVLASTGVFFQHEVLLIVEQPEPVDAQLVLAHHEHGSNDVCILLYQEGKIKAGSGLAKVADGLPRHLVARFDKPKPWEEGERAAEFCMKEASRRGIRFAEPLARGIVQFVGTDLGMLTFEVEKVALLLAVEGRREATANDVKDVLGAFTDIGPQPVVDALERRDLLATSKALVNVRRTHAGNLGAATMRTCGLVSKAVRTWLHVAALDAEGANLEEVAAQVKKHPFLVRKTLLPTAKRWGRGGLTSLLKSLAQVERSVKSGHLSPWVELECALLDACRSSKGGR